MGVHGTDQTLDIHDVCLYLHAHMHLLSLQGVEKLIVSKLLVEGSNRRIYNVDRHAGMVRGRGCEM